MEEANHSKEDCEVGENAILPRTVSPNQQWFHDNIDLGIFLLFLFSEKRDEYICREREYEIVSNICLTIIKCFIRRS